MDDTGRLTGVATRDPRDSAAKGSLLPPKVRYTLMVESTELDTATCPNCEEPISDVVVKTLRSKHAHTAVKFWACPECATVLGAT
jgi:ribosomal protein L37AE/L43A